MRIRRRSDLFFESKTGSHVDIVYQEGVTLRRIVLDLCGIYLRRDKIKHIIIDLLIQHLSESKTDLRAVHDTVNELLDA